LLSLDADRRQHQPIRARLLRPARPVSAVTSFGSVGRLIGKISRMYAASMAQ
jgi:hypothetical protein